MGNNQREVCYKTGGNAGRKEILWEQGEARVQLALCIGRGTYSGAGLTHRHTRKKERKSKLMFKGGCSCGR